jgi:predicted hotdog family 3-hydroxylacyl-ACP dehydratase
LTYGFEKPTPEIMAAWGAWLESIKDNIIDMGHLSGGREISKAGTKDLPLGLESITGFMIMRADSLDEAEKMAQSNPYISSIRVYELMSN